MIDIERRLGRWLFVRELCRFEASQMGWMLWKILVVYQVSPLILGVLNTAVIRRNWVQIFHAS